MNLIYVFVTFSGAANKRKEKTITARLQHISTPAKCNDHSNVYPLFDFCRIICADILRVVQYFFLNPTRAKKNENNE